MARIFISYTRQDKAHAADLFAALDAAGHEVWWDEELRTADNFRDRIGAHVKRANAVIVIWSKISVERDWVVSEANLAFKEKKLVPVKFEQRTPQLPMPMDSMHVADLSGWSGERADARFVSLQDTIFKVAHDRFAETLIQFGGERIEQTIGQSQAARAIVEMSSTVFFIPTHRFIRGAVLCGLGLAVITFAVQNMEAQSSESFLEVLVRGLISISLARLFLQVVNLSKGLREQRFFDSSFSYWMPVFFFFGVVYFIYRSMDAEQDNVLGDSITIAVGGLATFYFIRCLIAGYNILVQRTRDGI